MKILALALIGTLSLSVSAHASGPQKPEIVSVSQSGNFMPPLPPGGAVVHSKIEIKYWSCAAFSDSSFVVKALPVPALETPAPLTVSIALNQLDCFGPTFERSIEVERTDLPLLYKVLVEQGGQQVELDVDDQTVN